MARAGLRGGEAVDMRRVPEPPTAVDCADTEFAAGQVPQAGGALSDYEDFAAGDDNSDEFAGEQI